MKVAYCGIDILSNCLAVLQKHKADIVQIFTYATDPFDRTDAVQAFCEENGIPLSVKPITASDMDMLAERGVELLVVAGYAARIPVTDRFMQVNIHPSYLPEGRGPWPMPVNLLRGIPSGVTLHKLSEGLDEGDILLQCRILPEKEENLQTLTKKIQESAEGLLDRFLCDRHSLWQNATPQVGGSYWAEPGDRDRSLDATVTCADAARIMRAFYGYGVLYEWNGILMEIPYGHVSAQEDADAVICLPLGDGYLAVEEWHPYFRSITIADRDAVEDIRRRYPAKLSDYTFAMLFCWQKTLGLQIYLHRGMYVVRAEDTYFCPVGEAERRIGFIDAMLSLYGKVKLRFCDGDTADALGAHYGAHAEIALCEDDCDYVIPIEKLEGFAGGKLHKRRIEYHHYRDLENAPEVIAVTEENIGAVKTILNDSRKYDSAATRVALRHFSSLGFQGVLVKREGRYVAFMLTSRQYDGMRQAHFCRCIDEENGAMLYLVRAAALHGDSADAYINLEDDMGVAGLRRFKQSLHGELIHSYTVDIG